MSSIPSPTGLPDGQYLLAGRATRRMGYGAMQLRNLTDDPAQAIAIIRRAIDLGVNHIDTALFYGNGFVNDVIRKAAGADRDILIATKVGADPSPHGTPPIAVAQKPDQLRASVEANLRSLHIDHIPLVNLRRVGDAHGMPVPDDQRVAFDDQLATMISLRDEGKIGAIGLSGVGIEELRRALPANVACVQNNYSVLNREHEDMLRLCTEQSVAWVPFFPLGGATQGAKKVTEQADVLAVAATLGVSAAQLGLAWLLDHAPNILLIPGTANMSHLQQNIDAASMALDDRTRAALERLE